MKKLAGNLGVALCGLVTSILIAVALVAIAREWETNLFTLTVWFVVPLGALGTGLFAASGYYAGALFFNARASWVLLALILAITGFTQFLIYWLAYTSLEFDNGMRIADHIEFSQYLEISLTSAHYSIGNADVGKVGKFGYLMAGIQFIGLLVGSAAVYFKLREKKACLPCEMYLRTLAKKRKDYPDSAPVQDYYDTLFTHPVESAQFATLMKSGKKLTRPKAGAYSIRSAALGCPGCRAQVLHEKIYSHNGQAWLELKDLERCLAMPKDIDMVPIVKG